MSKASTETLWARFGDRLRAFIATRVKGETDVEDVLQEVFAKIHAGLGRLNESEKLEAWLFQVARHAVLDHFRRRSGTFFPQRTGTYYVWRTSEDYPRRSWPPSSRFP
jgi:RNA polymerase sigma factor (sigma-70 family)